MTTSGIGPTGAGTGSVYSDGVSGTADRTASSSSAPSVSAGDRTDLTTTLSPQGEVFFAAAKDVRQADGTMSDAEGLLRQLQDQLQMVKLYPPYPVNEPRRAALVRQLLGVQKQIVALGGTASGLKLPQVDAAASHASVDQAIATTSAASNTIATRRATLARDTFAAVTRTTGSTLDPASATALADQAGQVLAGSDYALSRTPLSFISNVD